MFNSARKGRLVREQDLGAEEGCGEAGCCPGTGRILRGGPGPGLSQTVVSRRWHPRRGADLGGWYTRAADHKNHPKGKKRDSSERRPGTSAPAHSGAGAGASWHLRAPPRGRKCLSPVRWPQWSRWELRALVKWQSCESALGGNGKELGGQRPSASKLRTVNRVPLAGWPAAWLLGFCQPDTPHTHFLCGQRVTPCWAKLLLVESHARAAMAAGYSAPCLHPLSSDGSVSSQSQRLPQPYQLPWSLQNHPTFLETGQQKSGERGSSAGKQLNNREACLHTHYPEPDCPRTSHRAGSRTPLILCIFILLTLKDSGRKKNNAAQEK